MKLQHTFQLIIALFIMLATVSCETPPASDNAETSARMMPTDEYNYLLESEHLCQMLEKVAVIGEFDYEYAELQSILGKSGYGEPVIKGKTDGERIVLEAAFPVESGYEKKAKVLSKLASDRIILSGRINPDRLVGYFKMPGPQSILDTVHDYIDILIENDEGPTGKANPMVQIYGACMLGGVSLQEDVFSWMGDEMGCVLFVARDSEDKDYISCAGALSIKNKKNANDKIYKLMGIVQNFTGSDVDIDEILTVRNYKSFEIHGLNMELLGGYPEFADEFGSISPAILYTNDFIFISNNENELEQLADIYDPGGAQDERAAFAAQIDLDALLKYSATNRRLFIDSLKKEYADSPDDFRKIDELFDKFENLKQNTELGKLKKVVKFTPNAIVLRIEFTKTSLELFEFSMGLLSFYLGDTEPADLADDSGNIEEEIKI
jgi:hypothetical protein